MSTQPSSLERAFRDECEAGAVLGVESDPEQLDLLRDDTGRLPPDVFQRMRLHARGRGRPPGARNRASNDLAKLICQKHGDPVQYMASIYSMPIDQLIELMKIADGSDELTQRLMTLAESIESTVATALAGQSLTKDQLRAVESMIDRLDDISKILRPKIGDLAIKALNTQLAAARAVAEYVHSKKPVEVDAHVKLDGVIVMPPALPGQAVDQILQKVGEALNSGAISPEQLGSMRLIEGEFSEVADGDDDE